MNKPIDLACVLAFAGDNPETIERTENALAELRSVGVKAEPFWNVATPYDGVIERNVVHNGNCTGAALNITLGHLAMVKSAYNRGAQYAAFFEYDVRFLRDRALLKRITAFTPDDFDIAFLDWLPPVKATDDEIAATMKRVVNGYWRRIYDPRNASGYVMSRRAMRWYVDALEAPANGIEKLKVCDQMFTRLLASDSLIAYAAVPCACVQGVRGTRDDYDKKWARYRRIGMKREDYDD